MNLILLAVTGVSLTLAGFMTAIAWQMSRQERRRSDARVAALSAAIYEDADRAEVNAAPSAPLFADRGSSSTARLGIAAVAGACVIALVAGVVVVARSAKASRSDASRSDHDRSARLQPSESLQPSVSSAPLELIALEHERTGEDLVVRGLVRNPADAAERDGLSAVVLVLDANGGTVATARASLPAARLGPGATAPFVVNVTGAADVDRFRLSFRTDARVEPHVDRRKS